MLNIRTLEELKARLADRFTAAELVDLLDVSVEEIIEEYISRILANRELIEESGFTNEETEE